MYLQETNLIIKDQAKLRRGGFTQIFHYEFGHKSRGLAILLCQNVLFEESYIIRDKNGHYAIIQGKLFNRPVVLANFYAPNWDDVDFFRNLFSLLLSLDSHDLILGGDFNCVLDRKQVRSSTKVTSLSNSARCINTFLQAYGVIDPWRFKYPTSRQFSFFSPVHQTYSRIDYFLIDQKLLPTIIQVEYDSIVNSDHCPVLLKLRFPENILPKRTWRLNSRLLADKKFVDFINTQVDLFLETNESPEISYCTLWETMKAYVRGQVISYTAGENKKKSKRATELINRIKVVDQLHSTSPSENLYRERILLQTEFDSLTNDKAIDLYLKACHNLCEYGERASKLLSHQLKQSATAGFISVTKDGDGNIVTDQRDINAQFKSFYENLYTSEAADGELVENFFCKLEMPSLDESDKSELERDKTQMEINSAILKNEIWKGTRP